MQTFIRNLLKALIDLDTVLYRCLFATSKQNYYAQLRACDNSVNAILDNLAPSEYELVLSGGNNFRKKIDPTYKANRKPESRPTYLHDAMKYFTKYWHAVVTDGIEADDYIAINSNGDSVVVSNDKDFNQLGVPIYNWTKGDLFLPEDPMYYWYSQLLTGDAADNVVGIRGIGPVKAEKALKHLTNEERLLKVQEFYQQEFGDGWYVKFDINARLLWLKRTYIDEYYLHI